MPSPWKPPVRVGDEYVLSGFKWSTGKGRTDGRWAVLLSVSVAGVESHLAFSPSDARALAEQLQFNADALDAESN